MVPKTVYKRKRIVGMDAESVPGSVVYTYAQGGSVWCETNALKAVEFIRLNACRTISVQAVAAEMKTGRRSAEIRFRRQAGHSIQDEIDDVRFRTACELLRRRTVPLKTLHTRCGYTSARALRNLFLKKSGQTPTAWLAAQ